MKKIPDDIIAGLEESECFIWLTYDEVVKLESQISSSLMRLITKAVNLYSELKITTCLIVVKRKGNQCCLVEQSPQGRLGK